MSTAAATSGSTQKVKVSCCCLVTGGSRGIGREICAALAKRGADVTFTFCSNSAAADDTLALLRTIAPNGRFSALQSDTKHPESCREAIAAAIENGASNRLDVLVNNAGIAKDHDVVEMTGQFDAWRAVLRDTMETNFLGAADLSFLAAEQFIKQHGPDEGAVPPFAVPQARIINVTSRAVYRGELTAPGYAASKAALSIFGQSLARRLAPYGIAVYTVAPGWVATEMAQAAVTGPNAAEVLAQHPLGRIADPSEVAQQVGYLALEAPLAMTGCVVDVNGASYLR